jgi:hypothetical protein
MGGLTRSGLGSYFFVTVAVALVILAGIVVTYPGLERSTGTGSNSTTKGQFSASDTTCTDNGLPNRSNMSFEDFEDALRNSTSVCHGAGFIDITIGYHPCVIESYVLPNATDVNLLLGAPSESSTCA